MDAVSPFGSLLSERFPQPAIPANTARTMATGPPRRTLRVLDFTPSPFDARPLDASAAIGVARLPRAHHRRAGLDVRSRRSVRSVSASPRRHISLSAETVTRIALHPEPGTDLRKGASPWRAGEFSHSRRGGVRRSHPDGRFSRYRFSRHGEALNPAHRPRRWVHRHTALSSATSAPSESKSRRRSPSMRQCVTSSSASRNSLSRSMPSAQAIRVRAMREKLSRSPSRV